MANQPQRPEPPGQPSAPLSGRAAGLTAREKMGLAALSAGRAQRGALARLRRSRLMRWRHRSSAAEDLLLAPPDLRAVDTSFPEEFAIGIVAFSGSVVDLKGRSALAVEPPTAQWARELHGFGWLRHFGATRSVETEMLARRVVSEWLAGSSKHQGYAWAPGVVGRRTISWLSHAGLLLDGADSRSYSAIMRSLGTQATFLSASWRNAPAGYPRLLALIGLMQSELCIAGNDRHLAVTEKYLADELDTQILRDGGHLSRNPWVLVELLLDLLPLRQCFSARAHPPDPRILAAIARMTPMLRYLRLGDGMLARFNGMGTTERDALATVLAYDEAQSIPLSEAPQSGYVRLTRASTTLVADTGGPPPLPLAGSARAGCLSFELSDGEEPLLVNCGAPSAADDKYEAVSRATAGHNTLCVNEQSSSKMIRNSRLEQHIGAPPIQHPDQVAHSVQHGPDGAVLVASHDGYGLRYGLIHTRTLTLSASGTRLDGIDTLAAAKGVLRLAWDLPFAIHFHLHPDSEARVVPAQEGIEIALATGACWRLTATGAAASVEDSLFFADVVGPRRAQQIVLRALCCGEAEVRWRLERVGMKSPAWSSEANPARSGARLSERLAEAGAAFDSEPGFGT